MFQMCWSQKSRFQDHQPTGFLSFGGGFEKMLFVLLIVTYVGRAEIVQIENRRTSRLEDHEMSKLGDCK